jgi:hypothetical protein
VMTAGCERWLSQGQSSLETCIDVGHQPIWQRAEPILNSCPIDGCKLSDIYDRVVVQSGYLGWKEHIPRQPGQSEVAGQHRHRDGGQTGAVVLVGADHEHRTAQRRRRAPRQTQVRPPQLTTTHQLRSGGSATAAASVNAWSSGRPAITRSIASVVSSSASVSSQRSAARTKNSLRDTPSSRAARSTRSNVSSGREIAVFTASV